MAVGSSDEVSVTRCHSRRVSLVVMPLRQKGEPSIFAATREQLRILPPFAQVAFAARCARRAQTMYAISKLSSENIPEINRAIQIAEKLATAASSNQGLPPISSLDKQFDETLRLCSEKRFMVSSKLSVIATTYAASVFAANAAIFATRGEFAECTEQAWRAFDTVTLVPCIQIDYWADRGDAEGGNIAYEDQETMLTDLNRDLQLLQRLASQKNWDSNSRVDSWFFFPYFQFDIHEQIGDVPISDIIVRTNYRLLEHFRDNRQSIYSLSPRQFEELIAHLFDEFGFTVELTSQTRDKGRDIIAISNHLVKVKYLIECKRYAPNKPVGISVVQRLHGVTVGEGATKGIIATTARFTKPALTHLQQHEWLLEGRDIDGIGQWLRQYDAIRSAGA